MKVILLLLILLTACAHNEPSRAPASVDTEFFFDEVSSVHSRSLYFPSHDDIYFYIEAKNKHGKFVDLEAGDVAILGARKRPMGHQLVRQLRGRYYVILNNPHDLKMSVLNFQLQGKIIREQFHKPLKPAAQKTTKIVVLKKESGLSKLRLTLKDSQGKAVELPSSPEIISSNNALEITNLAHVKQGTWEFELRYSEHNVLSYLSVRAHGVYLENLFRFQHVESESFP